jgi:hypothetical protein
MAAIPIKSATVIWISPPSFVRPPNKRTRYDGTPPAYGVLRQAEPSLSRVRMSFGIVPARASSVSPNEAGLRTWRDLNLEGRGFLRLGSIVRENFAVLPCFAPCLLAGLGRLSNTQARVAVDAANQFAGQFLRSACACVKQNCASKKTGRLLCVAQSVVA